MLFKDQWSQRILALTLGGSALLLGVAFLIASIKWVAPAHAGEWIPDAAEKAPWDEGLRGAVGLGIKGDTAYFVIWSQPNQFYKVELSKARDWYED